MFSISRITSMITLGILTLGVMGIAAADHGGGQNNNGGNTAVTRHKAKLAGPSIQGRTPEGSASFKSRSASRAELEVEVEDVNLPAGTALTVTVSHGGAATTVGQITLSGLGSGELELNTENGDVVPAVSSGDVVTVLNGATAVVSGVFN